MSTATRTHATPEGDTLLLPANPARRAFAIANMSSGVLHIGLGPNPVSASEFVAVVTPHGTFGDVEDVGGELEEPDEPSPLRWFTGEVRGRWANPPSPGDTVQVTELTGGHL